MSNRRHFLRTGLASAAALSVPSVAYGQSAERPSAAERPGAAERPSPVARPGGTPADVARDEDYWRAVAAHYPVTDRVTNLEAGYWGMMATPVREAYHRHVDRVNHESSLFARTEWKPLLEAARQRVADELGLAPGEVLLTRNATEALQALIGQYNRLRPGETVMYADLDYYSMQWAMDGLAARVGADVATLVVPEPATRSAVIDAYAEALDAHPRTRLLLLTHANNKTGLVHPVREITELARARGVDVVVDAAQSWGQVPMDVAGFGADYVGINLHKWVGAPLGVGAMVIRERGIGGIDPAPGVPGEPGAIESRVEVGTVDFAAVLSVPDALDFQAAIGLANKTARLRYLRDLWVAKARQIPGVDVLTPDDPDLVGSITSFRLHGRGGGDANRAVAQTLLDEFGLFTVARTDIAGGDAVRVTPALYNGPADLERLVAALRVLAARG